MTGAGAGTGIEGRNGPTTAAAALTCRGLTVDLGDGPVVDGVDLDLRSGEWLGVIGPNGAGKSTLLRAAAGLIDHGGDVSLPDGRRPGPLDVAIVPQIPTVPDTMTVAEYTLIGRTAHLRWLAGESAADRRIVGDTLRRLDLARFADRHLGSLSGGERQRVVIARALVQDAPILFLDEPTSALDVGHQASVLELVDDLRHADGLSVLAVMHDLTTAARFADRLTLLDRGRLVTTGPPIDVLDDAGLSDVYGTPLTMRIIDGDPVVLPTPRHATPNPEETLP